MLNLYARVNNTTNSEAYQEICDALQAGDTSWGYGQAENINPGAGVPSGNLSAGSQKETGMRDKTLDGRTEPMAAMWLWREQ